MQNKLKRAFDQIHAEDTLLHHTKVSLSAYTKKKQRKSHRPTLRFAISVACTVLIVVVLTSYQAYFTKVSAIGFDTAPATFSLELNRFDTVIGVTSLDAQSEKILNDIHILHCHYTDAITQILQQDTVSQYIANGGQIDIGITSTNTEKSDQILYNMEDTTSHTLHCYQLSPELAEQAANYGISMGKYRIYLALQQQGNTISISDVQQMNMYQLQSLLTGETPTSQGEQNQYGKNQHHGNGHHTSIS